METTTRKYLLFILVAIIIIISAGFVILTLHSDIRDASDNYLTEKQELVTLKAHANQLEEVDHQKIKENINEAQNLFSNPERPIEDILFLEEVAENNNLSMDVRVGQKQDSSVNPWSYLEFNLDLEGSFPDILYFLREIETRRWLFSIDSFSAEVLESFDIEDENRNVSANLSLHVYFLD